MIDLLVIGGGALGLGFSAIAARLGHSVACCTRKRALTRARLHWGDECDHGELVPTQPATVAVLSVKAHDQPLAWERHGELLRQCPHLVVAQNGMGQPGVDHPDAIQSIVWACPEQLRPSSATLALRQPIEIT